MKKNISISLLLTLLVSLIVLAEIERKSMKFNALNIDIDVSQGNYFVDEVDIESQVFAKGYQRGKESIAAIDLRILETQFDDMPSVEKSQVYTTISGDLQVDITQRLPIARFFTKTASFYMDLDGYIMPLSEKYTAMVPVINGYLDIDYALVEGENFSQLNVLTQSNPELKKLYYGFILAKKFKEVQFWDAQFKQVFFRDDGDIELIPAVVIMLSLSMV